MSGIAAIYYRDGRPVDPRLINGMLGAAAYRGPDGLDSWIDGPVALGHAMLRTTPEAIGEYQPLVDKQAGLALTMDGRVDNRDELKDLLESQGLRLAGNTDAEIILRAYQCWGEAAPAKILGDFAFALWDGPARQLFCARDVANVQPLYYYCDDRKFICASEPQQVLFDPEVPREPDEKIIGVYLSGMLIDPLATLHRDLRKLEGGCSMTVRPDTILRRRYFDIDPGKRVRYRTDEEYAEHFASIFTEAVRCRLRNIDGIAAELSGGLDSSMVVGAIERLGRPGPHFDTFSLKFDDPQADERGFIQDVAQMWGLQTIWCEPFFAKFPDLTSEIRRYQYLGARPNTSMDALMHRAMRERGYRVVVTGQGGDEWFTGSPDCFADLLCEFRFGDLYRLIRDEAMYPTRVWPGHSRLGLLLRRTLWPLVPAEPKFLINRLRGIKLMPPFVNQDFLQKFELERARNAPTREILGLSYSQRSMYQVFNLGMAILYSELNERECAFAGLEGRHPLLDRRVIEYAFAIPEDQRCRPRAIKYVMRQAGGGILPESVRNRRTKAEFFCMLLSGLKVMTAGLGGESAFESFELARRGWIEPDALRNFYRQRIDDPTANLWPLWSVMELEIWARECLVGSLS